MITAWPTVSPVNVSATSSPLFMYSAYPSVSHNGSAGGGSLAESLGITPGSQTATILGAVAVGVLGVALVVGAVVYFRNGGTVAGLAEKVKANKGLITKAASMLPLTEEQKAKVEKAVNDPTSLLPEQAQQAIHVVQHAKEYEAAAISSLPISEEQKAQLTTVVSSVHDKIVKKAEATPTGVQLKKILKSEPAPVSESKAVTVVPVKEVKLETKPKEVKAETKPKEVKEVTDTKELKEVKEEVVEDKKETTVEVAPTLVALHISESDMEAVKAFLAEKEISHT